MFNLVRRLLSLRVSVGQLITLALIVGTPYLLVGPVPLFADACMT